MKKIDFEAHFYTEAYLKILSENKGYPRFTEEKREKRRRLWHAEDVEQPFGESLFNFLLDDGEGRIKRMNESGIDIQILSLSAPGIEALDPKIGTNLAKETNNTLSKMIHQYPDRLLGFAALAPKHPMEAADELERCVKDLGFVGWNTHAHYGDSYLDEKVYWPILERAEKLHVPIYLHPTISGYPPVKQYGFPLAGPPLGFGSEVLICLMRMIYRGIFDEFPKLMVILGHLGEGLPFFMKRIDWAYLRPFDPQLRPKISKKPSEYLKSHIFVTTSGNTFEPAFRCTYEALGIDRILLGTDDPYEEMDDCIHFLQRLDLSEQDKEKIYYLNAKQVGIGL